MRVPPPLLLRENRSMAEKLSRRSFLRQGSLGALPALLPAFLPSKAADSQTDSITEAQRVFFINEGPFYRPGEFIEKLDLINKTTSIGRDSFGEGGTIEALTTRFAEVTGKEAAAYVTSGTMANQLAISELSGSNSKVFVQETSHVSRDEADAAQTTFHHRLIPLAPGKAFFTLPELQEAMKYYRDSEAFETGIGVVSIETPVRRTDNTLFPIEHIREVSEFCRANGYKLHLDGARLHIASAYTGISVREFASYFDTVYMCLYKYLGATSGAVLCGQKDLISRIPQLVRVHGGSLFTSWPNAAMALYHLQGIDARLQLAVKKSNELFSSLNQIPGIEIAEIPGGTNTRKLRVSPRLDLTRFKDSLRNNFITTGVPQADGAIRMKVNETLLLQDNPTILQAFRNAARIAESS
jgi:threonine aldolase